MKSILEGIAAVVVMLLLGILGLITVVVAFALKLLIYGGALAVAVWIVATVWKAVLG